MTLVKPVKILCLHGYMQNAQILRRKTGALRKKLQNIAELVFVTAPHEVPMPTDITEEERARLQRQYDSEGGELYPYAWWFLKDGERYEGEKVSFEYIGKVLDEQGPFDGLLGFSQGGVLAALLASIYSRPDHPLRYGSQHPAFRFAILISALKPRGKEYTYLVDSPIRCPSLHMIGLKDTLIVPEESEALATCFENPIIYRHDNGHIIPTNAEGRNTMFNFVKNFASTATVHM